MDPILVEERIEKSPTTKKKSSKTRGLATSMKAPKLCTRGVQTVRNQFCPPLRKTRRFSVAEKLNAIRKAIRL